MYFLKAICYIFKNENYYWLFIVSPSNSSPMSWVPSTLLSRAKLYSRASHSMFFVLRKMSIFQNGYQCFVNLAMTESTAVTMYCSSVSVVSLQEEIVNCVMS